MRVAEVHLLDVGTESYGDCLLLRFDTDGRQTWVLIDGGHRSDKMRLVDQFTDIMRRKPPFRVDLLLISHAHDDHIGALPDLVRDGYVLANYALIPDSGMAFGPPFDKEAAPDAVSRAIALLREEPLEDVESTEELDALAIDAASLRTRYDEMRRHLTNAGTDVVLFGSGSTVGLARLRRAFTHIGLKILGPSPTALDRAAELLRSGGQNVIDAAKALRLTAQDSGVIVNALDAQQRLGHLVNAQSVVCTFSVPTLSGPRNILLGGDFQFASLGSSDETLMAERDRLLKSIAEQAPYVFAKLSHHGSDNAVSPGFLDALGSTDVVGICCGRGHPAHPNPDTLQLLNQRAASPRWIRTDRSGHLKMRIEADGYAIFPSGATNILEPNAPDAAAATTPTRTTPLAAPAAAVGSQPRLESMAFEIPARATTVTIKFDLILAADATSGTAQPVTSEAIVRAPTSARLSPGTPTQPSNRPTLSQNKFEIGGGRDLPPLLFLTDLVKLGEHITPNVVATIIDAIGRGGHRVCDVANVGASTVDDIAAALRARIDERPPAQVVILGGYDVIPSAQVESIPPETSASMKQIVRAADPDGFVVWSDDSYVDIDGDWLPEIPVSRVPDCHDALFTLKALQAEPAATKVRSGIRNSAREFVIEIFDTLPGATSLLVSGPTDSRSLTPGELDGSHFYCMLHGSDSDATRFWGEWPTGNCVEAVTLGHLPTSDVDFAVLGCCWGALPASTKAADWKPGQPIVGRLAGQSIALTLLAAGARGVFGCTGAHWSPTKPPYDTASGPFHRALWRSILACNSPAAALLEAKYDFSSRLTTLTDANDLAIAYKTLAQFTCLGLGC